LCNSPARERQTFTVQNQQVFEEEIYRNSFMVQKTKGGMVLYIKNMACIRCKMIVTSELEKLGLHKISLGLGELKIKEIISPDKRVQLDNALKRSGFELLDESKGYLVEKIKRIIIELVHYSDDQLHQTLPEYIGRKLHLEYASLNTLFFEVQNTTIEDYFNFHKIERVKELIVYYKLGLNEIAHQLNYSSISHLTSQFKAITGLPPSHFQKMREIRGSAKRNVRMM